LSGNGYDYGMLSGMPQQAMPNVPLYPWLGPYADYLADTATGPGVQNPRPTISLMQGLGAPLQSDRDRPWYKAIGEATQGVADAAMTPGPAVENAVVGALPMDYASRMARAKAMGFDTPVYHGTGADIREFNNAMSVRQAYGAGTHVAENPNLANVFASQFREGGRVMPLMVRLGKVADADTFKQYANIHGWDMGKTTNALKADGYDSVKYAHGQYYNISEGKLVAAKEGEDTAYAILNPENIRSKAAAFDPKKRGSRDIMAGLAALAAGTAGLAASDRSQQ
jgi:hypothetical protein